MTVRVLIVDDQAPFREAARAVVELTDGFEVAGEVESGEDAVTGARDLDLDLVLMDVNLRASMASRPRSRFLPSPIVW